MAAPARRSLFLAAVLAFIAVAAPFASAQRPAPGPAAKPPAAAAANAPKDSEPAGPPFMGAVLLEAAGSQYRDPIRTQRLIEDLRRSPFSDIVIQVRAFGDAYYSSGIVPLAWGVPEKFDPLAELIKGLRADPAKRVHVWFTPFLVANKGRAVPLPAGHVRMAHEDWLSRDSKLKTEDPEGNQYLEPGLDEVVDHLDAVVAELAAAYEFDSIIFDDMRYPGLQADWGYHPRMIDAWRKKTGQTSQPEPFDSVWSEGRREAVDRALRRLAASAKKARPAVSVGVFALAEGAAPAEGQGFDSTIAYQGALQNWAGWAKEKYPDFILLKNYRAEGEEGEAFDAWNRYAAEAEQSSGVEFVTAIAGNRNISLDALAQFRRARDSGLAGAALFSFSEPIQDATSRELFFRALAKTVLAPDSERKPFPKMQASPEASAFPPEPPKETASAMPPPEKQTPPPREAVEIPPPPSEEAAEPPTKTPEPPMLIEPAAGRIRPPEENLIRPSTGAVEYLKRKFPNIF